MTAQVKMRIIWFCHRVLNDHLGDHKSVEYQASSDLYRGSATVAGVEKLDTIKKDVPSR
jgi:hypothetical protein